MKINKLLPLLLAMVMVFGLAAVGNAQMKFGYIDSDRIMAEYSEWNKADEEFKTQYNAWEQEARDMQAELEEMIADYERQALILSAEKKAEREAAINAKRQSLDVYTRTVFGPGGEAERKQNTLAKPILDKINAAIEQLMTEGNYDFIFNSAGLAQAKKEYDLTDKVIGILEE